MPVGEAGDAHDGMGKVIETRQISNITDEISEYSLVFLIG
jgi:hypothetical protein